MNKINVSGAVGLYVILLASVVSGVESSDALAETYSFTASPLGDVTYAPIIPVGTSYNVVNYSSSFHWVYSLYSFNVNNSGDYTLASTTNPVINTVFVLEGAFIPSSTFPPATPIGQFIASSFSGGNTATIPNLTLTAGDTYSVLVAYNQTTAGSYPSYTVTLTFTGPGCAQIYTNVCAPIVTDRQITEELKIQAAQQGMILSDMQSDAIVGQLHQRMGQWGGGQVSAVPLALADSDVAQAKYESLFDNAMSPQAAHSGWTAWADTGADGLRTNWNSDVRGYQAAQQFGLDYRMANGWVAGVSFGGSVFNSDFGSGGNLSGSAYWLSPYLGMTVDNWLVTLQTAYTYTDYDTFDTGTGISGDTYGQRLSGSLSLSRQFDLGQTLYVVPEVMLSAGRDRISTLSALQQGGVGDPGFFSSKLGGEIGYKLSDGGRLFGRAYAEYTSTNAKGVASYLSTDYQSQAWSATLGGGVDVKLGERARLSLQGDARGIGADRLVYGGNVKLSLDF